MNTIWPTFKDVGLSCLRWSLGVLVGCLAATILNVIESVAGGNSLGTTRRRAEIVRWIGDFLRAIPVIAMVPLVQYLSVSEWSKVGLIAWAVMFPIWLAIRQSSSEQMMDAELALQAGNVPVATVRWRYHFPKVVRGLLKGVEIAIGVGWISVVAAELVGTYSSGFWAGGLGHRVVVAHDANNWSSMLVSLLLFGALGIGSSYGWRYVALKGRTRINRGFDPVAGHGG